MNHILNILSATSMVHNAVKKSCLPITKFTVLNKLQNFIGLTLIKVHNFPSFFVRTVDGVIANMTPPLQPKFTFH